jgi:hypothetical protein
MTRIAGDLDMTTTIGFDMTDGAVLTLTGESAYSLARTLTDILPFLSWDQTGVYQGNDVLYAFAVMHKDCFVYDDGEWSAKVFHTKFGDGIGEIMHEFATDAGFVEEHLDPMLDDTLSYAEHAAQERDMLHRL